MQSLISHSYCVLSIKQPIIADLTAQERADKYYDILHDNLRLKTHQQALDEEIKKYIDHY